MSNAGSRLGEIPLAWASCLLAQKPQWVAWATIRGEKDLGEFISARHCFHLQQMQIRTTSNNPTVSYIHINRQT